MYTADAVNLWGDIKNKTQGYEMGMDIRGETRPTKNQNIIFHPLIC